MPRIQSILNGEISNVRGDIARELIKMGVATALDPKELEQDVRSRLPKPGDARPPAPIWSVEPVLMDEANKKYWLAIRRQINWDATKRQVDICFLPPDFVHNRRSHDGRPYCSNFGVRVPDEIFAEYKRQWKASPDLRAPYEGRPAVDLLDEDKDRAAIEAAVERTRGRVGPEFSPGFKERPFHR